MPNQADLNSLQLVQRLQQAGSFTAAAEQLGCSKTTISLQLKALEQQLGIALFRRTTRQLSLTRAGEQLLRDCLPLLDELQQALQQLQSSDKVLQGKLVLSAPEDYTNRILAPAVVAFMALHPALEVEFRSSDQVKDLIKEGIDLSIRAGWLKDSGQHARKLGNFEQWLLAAPGYLAQAGTPQQPADLASQRFIAFTPLSQPQQWTFSQTNLQTGATQQVSQYLPAALKTSSTQTITALMLAGAGMGILPDYSARDLVSSGQLIRLLPDWSLAQAGIYAVYPPGRFRPARVTAFVDFLQQYQQLV
ncbi:DNA-binding transcriptional regulator, LysR family [Rheinheimera pacifica]|uniref:DNA-binding transcriptional regulator, LysR family n=1 Tax=Rheinheimera pacifica TaxID=173990 RepID=A0A1H6L5M2_9GAMM|nr:LysR family transcriptional regulator [Rheinheimera pacifica]SEH79678.1 DNA-binding transcriptional regulator, LysR family [Rheinheimera pacifica]